MPRSRLLLACGVSVSAAVCLASCDVDLGPRQPQAGGSFGAIVFREACERVTYSAELAGQGAVDVSGQKSRALCRGDAAPTSDAAPTVQALFAQRDNIVAGVDEGVPDKPYDLQTALDGYLRAVQPLQDDFTLPTLIERTAAIMKRLQADDDVVKGLARLGHVSGIRPPSTAGGAMRAVAAAPGLDELIGAVLPLLDEGGVAAAELQTLLRAGAFELKHLSRSTDEPKDRTAFVARRLLLSTHPDLSQRRGLPVALRDARGLPILSGIAGPYVADMATGLALADPEGYFLDQKGQRIPYVPPLPEPGSAATGSRDSLGRALRGDGKPLYEYADLDGSLLLAGLADAYRLLDDQPAVSGGTPRNMLFGMLQGAALFAGSRAPREKTRDGETIAYKGFDPTDSTLLDLVHAAAQLLRFSPQSAGQDLADLLRGTRTLLGASANEGALAHATRALLAAADEAKHSIYDGAQLPESSTLYDDLVPVLRRLLSVDDGQLAEDLVLALADDHAKNLGPIMAQLADDRGYFFMRQVGGRDGLQNLPTACTPDADEANNGLSPCGVIGELGSRPDRSAPDSDATNPWRIKKTSDPQNNRSVLQRLLHMVADANNGHPFCNGRYAQFFTDDFPGECDMFQVDNVARFFLLSMATPALRARSDTWAKQSASFREAIANGKNCRGTSGDANAGKKCTKLLQYVSDGVSGDLALSGLLGIGGFGRYPDPAPAARAIFMDLSGSMLGPSQLTAQQLLFNWKKDMAGGYSLDTADADNRKFRDGAGVLRLFIDEHNGVLFALEKVHGPARLPDGTTNKYPNDNFYDAMRPIVDAFAKHAECAARDMSGTCTRWQNATQILADAMSVLHRHYPSMRSQVYGRDFAASYGPQVSGDAAVSYEPLLAKLMGGELLLAGADLVPTLKNLTVDGTMGGRRVLPLFVKLGRFVFDPSAGPTLLTRDRRGVAVRNDGKPAGPVTVYYLLADALKKKRQLFSRPENAAAKVSWERAQSDALDVLLQVNVATSGGGERSYRFEDARLRPMAGLLLDFLAERVLAHGSDLPGYTDKLVSDASDAVLGPVAPALLDLSVKLSSNVKARAATYALLRQLFDPSNVAARDALAVAAIDAVQLFLDEDDLLPIGRDIAAALDPDKGPVLPAVRLLRRGRELEQASDEVPDPKQVPLRLLKELYQPGPSGLYPLWRLSDAMAEVNRAHPKTGAPAQGDFTAEDYRAVLSSVASFLVDEKRGLWRFLDIVRSRCLLGSPKPGCPGGM